jgi:hypothetical protein
MEKFNLYFQLFGNITDDENSAQTVGCAQGICLEVVMRNFAELPAVDQMG